MFNWFKKVNAPIEKPESQLPAQKKLNAISDSLFPKYETKRDSSGVRYHVDSSVDMNLEAVISDIEDGYVDKSTVLTLKAIAKKINEVRAVLNVMHELDPEVHHFFYYMPTDDGIEETEVTVSEQYGN